MNFTELKDELFARGTDYLNEDAAGVARAERWLNQAYREILNLQAWPFLVSTATGNPGDGLVEVADLRKLLSVVDDDTHLKLTRVSVEDIQDDGDDPLRTGPPSQYWIDGTTVRAFPVGGTISVRYIRRVDPMSGTDEPIFDEEYHNLVVDRAMIKAYIDSDNFEAATALRAEYSAGVVAMTQDYMQPSRDVQYILVYPYDG